MYIFKIHMEMGFSDNCVQLNTDNGKILLHQGI